jgi:ketopantoate reductase
MNAPMPGPVLVMGAGSVGCYVGGRLLAAGAEVHFVARPRVLHDLQAHGLTVTDLDGGRSHMPAAGLHLHGAVPAGLAPALVLLCVKSGATAQAAAELAAQLPAGTAVLSLQNGVANAELGAAAVVLAVDGAHHVRAVLSWVHALELHWHILRERTAFVVAQTKLDVRVVDAVRKPALVRHEPLVIWLVPRWLWRVVDDSVGRGR